MMNTIKVAALAGMFAALGACDGSVFEADSLTTLRTALSKDDAEACGRVTRARLADLSSLVDEVLVLVRAEIADPKGSTDDVDAIYYNQVKSFLDTYRARPELGFSDDAPGAVPTPATVEALPYQVGIMQQNLDTARFRTFVRSPRTSRVRQIGDKAATVARGIEGLAQDAYDCHEGITGTYR